MSATDTLPDWMGLQGTTLEGGYELKEIVEAAEGHAVLRVRVLGDYTLKASASFYVAGRPTAEEQVAIWQTLRGFESKANVSVPLGSGILTLNGVTLAYLVCETADETLGDVLAQRSLRPEEAADLLRAVARGMGELHSNGFVHGLFAPTEVLAVRDDIQVSTECIRRINAEPLLERKPAKYLAPESNARNLTTASDVWCLGATIFEALTQKEYQPELREEAAGFKHPLGALMDCCLNPDPEGRCKLGDLDKILRSKAPLPVKAKPAAAPPEPEPKLQGAVPITVTTALSTPLVATAAPVNVAKTEPLKNALTDRPAEKRTVLPNEPAGGGKLPNELGAQPSILRNEASPNYPETAGSGLRNRGWIYAIGAFVVIFAMLWFVRSRSQARNADAHAAGLAKQEEAPRPEAGTAWPTKTLTPDGKAPVPGAKIAAGVPASAPRSRPAEAPAATASTGASTRTIWRVVLYTYSREQDAQNKAHAISEKRPDLHAEVFPVGDSGGPYLVVAGGRMNRDGAIRMRQQAIREGMPHDTYVQNYSR